MVFGSNAIGGTANMTDFDYYDIETGEGVSDAELHDRFDDLLDETAGEVRVGGLTYAPSAVLQAIDPIAYRCGFNDWLDSELGETLTDTHPAT